jgi:hypothetical protein
VIVLTDTEGRLLEAHFRVDVKLEEPEAYIECQHGHSEIAFSNLAALSGEMWAHLCDGNYRHTLAPVEVAALQRATASASGELKRKRQALTLGRPLYEVRSRLSSLAI